MVEKPPFNIKIDKGPFTHEPDSILADNATEAAAIYRNLEAQKTEPMPEEVDKFLKKYPYIGEIIKDRTMSSHKKKMAMMPVYKEMRDERAQLIKDRNKLDVKIEFARLLDGVPELYEEWKKLPPKLEKNDCSRLHQLVAFLKYQYRVCPEDMHGESPKTFPWHEVTPFVVEHEWAAAFQNATDYNDGTFNLPYEKCAFEFRISGRPVIVLAGQDDKEHEPNYRFYIGFKEGWLSWSDKENETEHPALRKFAIGQIKAICVALDAEVAVRRMVRVDSKVNRKREKEGREPFYSYHVIDLNRRYRVSNPSHGGGVPTGKRRLHFRRGHWRHYEKFKTWVRWCLAGNPDIGFIDKEYRL